MKTYSVEEVSTMLNTNPETVRRWIRNNKLQARRNSKKQGWEIDENDLISFLTKSTKYKEFASTVATMGGTLGSVVPVAELPILLGGAVLSGAILASGLNAEKEMKLADIEPFVESTLLAHRVVAKQKREELLQLEDKLNELKRELQKEERLIKELESLKKNTNK